MFWWIEISALTYCISAQVHGSSRMSDVGSPSNRSSLGSEPVNGLEDPLLAMAAAAPLTRIPVCPGSHVSVTLLWLAKVVRSSKQFQINFGLITWHSRAFIDTWLSKEVRMSLLLQPLLRFSPKQTSITYISVCKTTVWIHNYAYALHLEFESCNTVSIPMLVLNPSTKWPARQWGMAYHSPQMTWVLKDLWRTAHV